MSSHFPIFVDVLSAPPLVIGDSDVLTPKIRLLLKIAPVVDVVATLPSAFSALASSDHVQVLDAVTPHDDAVLSMFAGRPLVIIETGDLARNKMLALHARSLGVPGLDYCNLANARSLPLADKIFWRFDDADRRADIGALRLNILGQMKIK